MVGNGATFALFFFCFSVPQVNNILKMLRAQGLLALIHSACLLQLLPVQEAQMCFGPTIQASSSALQLRLKYLAGELN
jgi:hypothetical protein